MFYLNNIPFPSPGANYTHPPNDIFTKTKTDEKLFCYTKTYVFHVQLLTIYSTTPSCILHLFKNQCTHITTQKLCLANLNYRKVRFTTTNST